VLNLTHFSEGAFMKRISLIAFLILVALAGTSHSADRPMVPREYVHADRLFSQGRYAEAIRSYQAVLSSSSHALSPGLLHTRIADSFFHLTDYRHALDEYRQALKDQKPVERAQTQYWIGFCALLLGRDAEAVTEFLKIPENYPASGMWISTAYYWAGRASERLGRKEQAAEFYRKAGGKGKSTQERFAMKKAKSVNKGSGVKGQGASSKEQGAGSN
jgi:tetratricopeptide (TPR) repeat protein